MKIIFKLFNQQRILFLKLKKDIQLLWIVGQKMKNDQSVQCKEHPNQNISILCLQKECQLNRGICSQCKLFTHNDHATKLLKLALLQISDDLLPRPQILDLIVKIDNLYFVYKNAIKKAIGKSLKSVLIDFFRQIHQEINRYPKICQSILQSSNIGIELYRSLKFYKFYQKNEGNKNKNNYQIFLQEIIQFLQQKLQELHFHMDSKSDLNKLLKIFQPFSTERTITYHFSQIHKSPFVKMSNNCLTISQESSYTCNIVIIQPVVNSKGKFRGKKSIKIKVHKPASYMSLGVAYLSVVKKNNFLQTNGDIGHGTYVLSYQGYSFHHSNSELNSFYHTFVFKDQEIITVTINTLTQRILFQKQTNQTVELPYDQLPNQDLYFCACLSHPNESFTIMN